jgi:hypothetical protein
MIPIITNCNHIFNQTDIEKWIIENETCPICREVIIEINDLEIDNTINVNLQKIKIVLDGKQYEYQYFINNIYCCKDNVDIETIVESDDIETVENDDI